MIVTQKCKTAAWLYYNNDLLVERLTGVAEVDVGLGEKVSEDVHEEEEVGELVLLHVRRHRLPTCRRGHSVHGVTQYTGWQRGHSVNTGLAVGSLSTCASNRVTQYTGPAKGSLSTQGHSVHGASNGITQYM